MEELPKFERDGEGARDVGITLGEHDIQYLIYDGRRVIRASPDPADRRREMEALVRLELWKAQERRRERRRERVRAGWQPWASLNKRLAALGAHFQRGLSEAIERATRETPAAP